MGSFDIAQLFLGETRNFWCVMSYSLKATKLAATLSVSRGDQRFVMELTMNGTWNKESRLKYLPWVIIFAKKTALDS